MGDLAAVVVPSVIAGICAIVGSLAGASDVPVGWVRTVSRMIDVHDRLPESACPRAFEVLAKRMLRQEIYERVYAGLGYRMEEGVPVPRASVWPSVREAVVQSLCALVGTLVVMGVPETPERWAAVVIGLAIGWLVVRGIERILQSWPAASWNPVYRRAEADRRRKAQAREQLKRAFDRFDSDYIADYSKAAESTRDDMK